ncbi:hypothetical protein D584_13934 [Brucella intermedia M86]|uniref:Uncharacterized protein n=2 Tax=Brucella intermedia TaxID=94625 RepID=M5JND4_9HYPH|nr:hypothetical protein D584_13934 [Brucella intermedia M86]
MKSSCETVATEIALDPNGIIAAVRECARMTAPDLTDSEFDALRVKLDPLFINTKHQMERAIRAYLSAAKFTASRKQVLEDVARWHDAEAERKRTVAVRNKRLEAQIATHEVSAARFRVLAAAPEPAYSCPPVMVLYTNYRGETSERTITPIRPWFGSTEWHPEPQWLLRAYDHNKGAERDFALKDFGRQGPSVARALSLEDWQLDQLLTGVKSQVNHNGWEEPYVRNRLRFELERILSAPAPSAPASEGAE